MISGFLEPDCRAALDLGQCNAAVSEKGRPVPLVRYFVVMAGVLLAMLAFVNWCLPAPTPVQTQATQVDRTAIRIRSDHKWPQKIEFDTTMHPFVAPSAPAIATAPIVKPPSDALAQAATADAQAAPVKPSEPKAAKPKPRPRTARRAPRLPPPMRFAVNPLPPPWPFGW